jgi:preprotein translocase subunit YajC
MFPLLPRTGLYLAATSTKTSSAAPTLIFIALLLGVFYFLLVRPQKRRMRTHQDLVSTLNPGDEIVTIGGIVGYIKAIDDDAVHLEITDGCVIRVVKQAIARKVEEPVAPEAPSEDLEESGGTDDT